MKKKTKVCHSWPFFHTPFTDSLYKKKVDDDPTGSGHEDDEQDLGSEESFNRYGGGKTNGGKTGGKTGGKKTFGGKYVSGGITNGAVGHGKDGEVDIEPNDENNSFEEGEESLEAGYELGDPEVNRIIVQT